MPLTKQQLLIPRVLCLGEKGKRIWPGSIWLGGDIIEESPRHGDLMYCDTDGPRYSDFPHLFKPLPWWYGRTVEEMPLYVNTNCVYGVLKVQKWVLIEENKELRWRMECEKG